MPTAASLVSIVISAYNGSDYVKRCLESILSSSWQNFEILIADDGSSDRTREILAEYQNHVKVKVFFFDENQGPSRIRNFLCQKCRGKYLFFLDVDTEIESNCLATIFEKLEGDPRASGLQAALIKENGLLETAGHFLSRFGFPYEIDAGEPLEKYQKEFPIFGARTAALAVRREIFEKIGGFDEDYLIYGEDTDFCWRIWSSGGRIVYFPESRVRHFQKSSFNKRTAFRLFYEGAKTGPANIIKNASGSMMIWMLPLNLLGWKILSLRLFFQGRFSDSLWIYRGLLWNLKNFKKTLSKRKGWPKNPALEKIIFGRLSFFEIIKKGLIWSKNV